MADQPGVSQSSTLTQSETSTLIQSETSTAVQSEATAVESSTSTALRSETTAVQSETPTAKRQSQLPKFETDTHEERKNAAIQDMKSVSREVPYDFFLDKLLPPIRDDIDIAGAIGKLALNGTISGGRFTKFEDSPRKIKGNEDIVYRERLQEVVKQIVEAARSDDVVPTLEFVHSGRRVPESKHRSNDTRPDSFAILTTCLATLMWFHLAFLGEVKKNNTPTTRFDDDRKIAWNMSYCLCEDRRRRFIFGFTIEDTEMRLWFCDREVVLVSLPFNFITNYHVTIRVFLSLMFAKPDQLGWDPSMRRLENGEFDIEVRSEDSTVTTYRTVKCLSDRKADSAIGSGTRIWKAFQLDVTDPVNPKLVEPPVTLKDTWVEYNREREGSIYHNIRVEDPSPSFLEIADEYFLTLLMHGDVHVEGQVDDTHSLIMRGNAVPDNAPRFLFGRPIGKARDLAAGSHIVQTTFGTLDIQAKTVAMVHYRTVWKGVYTPLFELSDLKEIFCALSQAALALQSLHKVGRVHRNLNPTNILVDERGTIQLSGFDHTKDMRSNNTAAHSSRDPLEDFVAVEVARRRYTFKPGDLSESDSGSKAASGDPRDRINRMLARRNNRLATSGVPTESSSTESSASIAPEKQLFRYNPLHDLESLWWTAAYFIVYKSSLLREQDGPAEDEHLLEARKELFYNSGSASMARLGFLSTPFPVDSLHPTLQRTGRCLERLRDQLVRAYTTAEKDIANIDYKTGAKLSEAFVETFLSHSEELEKSNVSIEVHHPTAANVQPLPRPKSGRTKRRIEEAYDDSDDSDYFPDDSSMTDSAYDNSDEESTNVRPVYVSETEGKRRKL